MMFIFFFIGMCPMLVKAENATLEEEYLKGVYYVMTSPEGEVLQNHEPIFRLDGKIAYCLEPAMLAKAGEYRVTSGLSGSYLSDEKKAVVEEIGYYGYEYPGHQQKEYYLAAQELIWEAVSSYEAKWVTSLNGGTEINVEKEKQEIIELIEKGKKIPSFHLETIHIYEEEFVEIHDTNNVLDQFEVFDPHFRVVNGILVGQGLTKDITLKGSLQSYDKQHTLLYRQDDSQKMATLRLSSPTTFEVQFIVDGISMKIHKIGEAWNGIWNSGEWKSQGGVEFEIYAEEDIIGHFNNVIYTKDSLIQTLTTNKNGIAETKKLPDGRYRLVETKGKDHYRVTEAIIFEIDSSVEKNPELEVKNQLSTGKVEILKTDDQGMALSGVVFGLYSKGGKKLDEQTTNQDGKIMWERLPIGEYQIRELKTLEGFVLDTTKEKISVVENQTILLEKVNVPLLPNTSGRTFPLKLMIGLFGLVASKRFLW